MDTETWKWRKLEARLHNKTCFHGAVVTKDGCVYVFGGAVDGAFTKRCSVMQRLWLRVPPLQYLTMCAVLSARPELLQNRSFDSPQFTLSNPSILMRDAFAWEQKRQEEVEGRLNNSYANFASYVMKLVIG
ncbi:unnamed protein product [Toxocara canis]|uniref:Uncharacterized protein n=1 Tax=Toxocara canis TaxID=6265 RepID=A0A3P7FZB1_TOXCA|nr:unnamed protein product [Toxocara canis]